MESREVRGKQSVEGKEQWEGVGCTEESKEKSTEQKGPPRREGG
jgi:hypothetical protein